MQCMSRYLSRKPDPARTSSEQFDLLANDAFTSTSFNACLTTLVNSVFLKWNLTIRFTPKFFRNHLHWKHLPLEGVACAPPIQPHTSDHIEGQAIHYPNEFHTVSVTKCDIAEIKG